MEVDAMKSTGMLVNALVVALTSVVTATGATFPGVVGDGKTSVYYVASTGELGILPDGHAIGIFQILSASGIFTAEAVYPPGGLFDINTATEKGWAAIPGNVIRKDFSLGVIVAPALTSKFLLNDLTMFGPRLSGQDVVRLDLVVLCCTPLIPRDANLGDHARGAHIEHIFTATGEPPMAWSNLILTSTLAPASAPSLSATGRFSWNSAGSAPGTYNWDATVSNSTGRAMASLTVRLVPESNSLNLAALAIVGLFTLWHRPH
jgi:hypothetical protein